MRRLLIALILVHAAPVAHAAPAIAVDPEPPPPADRRFEFEASAAMTISRLGDLSVTGGGPQIAVGYRTGGLSLLALGGALRLSATDYPGAKGYHARALRLGGAVRQSFVTLTPGVEMDLAGELSAERRFISWSGGGALERDAVMAGFILNMDIRDVDGVRRDRRGLHYAVRMGAATGPDGSLDLISVFELGGYWSP
jgi:hypothetical protein